MTVFSGAQRRRRWDEADKISLVARAFAPGAVLTHVARAVDVHPSQIYRWRRELGVAPGDETSGFAQVVVQEDGGEKASGSCAIRVRVGHSEVEIAEYAPAALVRAVLKALSR
ncbi:MAG: transposase [Novosphingobium sp.]|nr:transposase [Novosphingobium sp.]